MRLRSKPDDLELDSNFQLKIHFLNLGQNSDPQFKILLLNRNLTPTLNLESNLKFSLGTWQPNQIRPRPYLAPGKWSQIDIEI